MRPQQHGKIKTGRPKSIKPIDNVCWDLKTCPKTELTFPHDFFFFAAQNLTAELIIIKRQRILLRDRYSSFSIPETKQKKKKTPIMKQSVGSYSMLLLSVCFSFWICCHHHHCDSHICGKYSPRISTVSIFKNDEIVGHPFCFYFNGIAIGFNILIHFDALTSQNSPQKTLSHENAFAFRPFSMFLFCTTHLK